MSVIAIAAMLVMLGPGAAMRSAVAGPPLASPLDRPAMGHVLPAAGAGTCGLRLDGAGPDARCSRYRDACLGYGNPPARCDERLEACTRCAVEFQDCESRVGRISGLGTSCEKCLAGFKRCTRDYDRRLPAKRP